MRRLLIQFVLPLFFCLLPLLGTAVVALCVPREAAVFFYEHAGPMEALILGLGCLLFAVQLPLCFRALRWRGEGFDNRVDRWVNHLAQAAEWFPILGLIGTVAGILLAFRTATGAVQPRVIAPAITATGAGLFMAFINILPPWIVILGRDLIMTLAGERPAARPPGEAP